MTFLLALRRHGHLTKQQLVRISLLFGAFWLPVILFAKLADEVRDNHQFPFDDAVLRSLHNFSNPLLDRLVIIITDFGSAFAIIPLTAVAFSILYWYAKRRYDAFIILFGVGGAAVANLLLKLVFHRVRPELFSHRVAEHSYSFPSGHAMASSALAFSVMAIFWPTRYRWIAIIIGSIYTVLIGLSRLYLGVHYPTDVLAGWLASFAWIIIVTIIIKNVSVRFRHKMIVRAK